MHAANVPNWSQAHACTCCVAWLGHVAQVPARAGASTCCCAPATHHHEPHRALQVRQSAFALVGDLSRCCISHVGAVLGDLLPLALANLEMAVVQQPVNNSACNNACWALGEAAIKVRGWVLETPAELHWA